MRAQPARVPAEGGPGRKGLGGRRRQSGHRGWQHAGARRGPPSSSPSRARVPLPRRQQGAEGGGEGAGAKEGVGRGAYLALRWELVGRAGWPGEGKRVGGGGGERGGSPCEM
jgi:hypothetical protein